MLTGNEGNDTLEMESTVNTTSTQDTSAHSEEGMITLGGIGGIEQVAPYGAIALMGLSMILQNLNSARALRILETQIGKESK